MIDLTEGREFDGVAAEMMLTEHANKLRRRLDDGFRGSAGSGAVSKGYLYAYEFSRAYARALGNSLRRGLATKETMLKSLEQWENYVEKIFWEAPSSSVPELVGELAFAAGMRAWFADYLEKLREGETDV